MEGREEMAERRGRGKRQKQDDNGVQKEERSVRGGGKPQAFTSQSILLCLGPCGCRVPSPAAPQVPQHTAPRPDSTGMHHSTWSLPAPHRPCPCPIPGSGAIFPTPNCYGVVHWSILKRKHHLMQKRKLLPSYTWMAWGYKTYHQRDSECFWSERVWNPVLKLLNEDKWYVECA